MGALLTAARAALPDPHLADLLQQAWQHFPSEHDGELHSRPVAERARQVGNLEAELTAEFLHRYAQPTRHFDDWLPTLTQRAQEAGLQRLVWLCRDAQALAAAEAGRHVEAAALAGLNDRLPMAARPPAERCLTLLALAFAHAWGGNFEESLRQAFRWVKAAEASGSANMESLALAFLAQAHTSDFSNHEDALAAAERAFALTRHLPTSAAQSNALWVLLRVLLRVNQPERALRLLRDVLAVPTLARALRSREAAVAAVYLANGLYDETAAALAAAPARMHPVIEESIRHVRVLLACRLGQYAQARELALREVQAVNRYSHTPYELAQLHDALREACDALGDHAGAEAAAREAFNLSVQLVQSSARGKLLSQQLAADPESSAVLSPQNQRRLLALTQQASFITQPADQRVPKLLAQVVHDLHNPTVGMLHVSTLLLMSELDDKQQRYVELMQQSATTLVRLIGDVLDLARLEAGRFRLDAQPFELKPWLQRVFSLFELTGTSRGLKLGLRLGPGLPRAVVGDAFRLQQVLSNLLSNAVKFTDQGSVDLVVQAEEGRDAQHCRLRLEVKDTGKGIAQEAQQRLFGEFEQEDESIGRHYGGSGLGLALSKQLVQAMGGCIGLHSVAGQGSVFWVGIDLPVAQAGGGN